VGGRFSVLSAVGLLPMAAAGIDVETVLSCAIRELEDLALCAPENRQYRQKEQNNRSKRDTYTSGDRSDTERNDSGNR
jgi:glucose-6-phosphate isomerase